MRPAAVADTSAIASSEAENLGPDAWSPALVADGVAGGLPTVHYLVADADGVVVGHAVASTAGDVVELQRIAVSPAARRTGVASALLASVVAMGDRVLLEVREDNAAAIGFYAARGFVELDRRPRYYRDGATAIVMELA